MKKTQQQEKLWKFIAGRIAATQNEPPQTGIAGLFFLTYDEKKALNWQGKVLGAENGYYLCQLFSWLDGRPTDIYLAELSEMKKWKFFNDEEEWKYTATKK